MAKAYRSVPLDEEEPLTGGDITNEKRTWKLHTESFTERLQRLSPHWAWVAHAVLLSISVTFFALSFCVKSAKHPSISVPNTYCTLLPTFLRGERMLTDM
jgi:hypothetical protein